MTRLPKFGSALLLLPHRLAGGLALAAFTAFTAFAGFAALAAASPGALAQERGAEKKDAEEKKEPEERLFSGPQKGEKLQGFKVVGVYDDLAGKEIDFIAEAADKPILLIFIHKVDRPSLGLTRIVTSYCVDKGKDALHTRVVWLDKDRSAAEAYLTRAKGSLAWKVPVGISVDGAEGPGAWGLNRNVSLTIVAGKDGAVTANHAIVQPSDTDAPKVLADAAALLGLEPPTAKDLAPYLRPAMRRAAPERPDPMLARLVRRLNAADIADEEVKRIDEEVGKIVAASAEKKTQLGQYAQRMTGAPDFEKTGTAASRELLKRWAREHGARPPR